MYRMLICDDENYILEMLENNIKWNGMKIEVSDTAINGQIGFNKFNTGRFDIVLTDIRMPVMSGIEMARKIRQMDKNSIQVRTIGESIQSLLNNSGIP